MNTHIEVNTKLSVFEESNTLNIFREVMRVRQRLNSAATMVAKQFDLHTSEMALLDTLGKYGPLTMGDLAERSFSSAANATYTIRGLEKRNLVKRERSTDSHRVVNVQLTRQGKQLFRKTYVQTVREVNEIIGVNLNKTERNSLLALLEEISSSIVE